jgi:predicted DNA-binding ribbon-helix-helix protein
MKTRPTVVQLAARLDEQTAEIASLKSALAVQFTRVAQLQAQIDVLPTARRRGEELRSTLTTVAASNGNGHRPPVQQTSRWSGRRGNEEPED